MISAVFSKKPVFGCLRFRLTVTLVFSSEFLPPPFIIIISFSFHLVLFLLFRCALLYILSLLLASLSGQFHKGSFLLLSPFCMALGEKTEVSKNEKASWKARKGQGRTHHDSYLMNACMHKNVGIGLFMHEWAKIYSYIVVGVYESRNV